MMSIYHARIPHASDPSQAFAVLVQLLFSVDNLDFNRSLDHVECFAGQMSVTKGEWAETRYCLVFFMFALFDSPLGKWTMQGNEYLGG